MAKVCEIIVNRDYIRENNAARSYVPLATVSTPAYVSLRVHVHLHRCIHTLATPAWCTHLSSPPLSRSRTRARSLFTSHSFTRTFPPRLLPVSLLREHTRVQDAHGEAEARAYTGIHRRKHSGCTHTREKKAGARERFAELPYREDVDIFFTCNERECRERHAFDWPGRGAGKRERGPWLLVEGGQVGVAWVDHPLPSIFRGFFLRATALACLDERTRGGTSIIYNQTADKATIALL